MAVNIKGTFKKDARANNGLERIQEDLNKRPHERRILVAVVRASRSVRDHEDGTETPTVVFDNIEVLDDEDGKRAWEMLAHAFEARTGQPAPPPSLFDAPNPRELDPELPLDGEDR